MQGETNIIYLLNNMNPELNAGDYVITVVDSLGSFSDNDILGFFREKEGLTVILNQSIADKANIQYLELWSWITLNVHSSLQSVGLTAAVSSELASNNISCNMVAGYFHDHIFVPKRDGKRSLDILKSLSVNNM